MGWVVVLNRSAGLWAGVALVPGVVVAARSAVDPAAWLAVGTAVFLAIDVRVELNPPLASFVGEALLDPDGWTPTWARLAAHLYRYGWFAVVETALNLAKPWLLSVVPRWIDPLAAPGYDGFASLLLATVVLTGVTVTILLLGAVLARCPGARRLMA